MFEFKELVAKPFDCLPMIMAGLRPKQRLLEGTESRHSSKPCLSNDRSQATMQQWDPQCC